MSVRALPEELLTKVLALLPNVVFEGRCRVVCRRWRDLQTSSAFRAARREVGERDEGGRALRRGLCLPRTVNGTGHTGPSEFCATSI